MTITTVPNTNTTTTTTTAPHTHRSWLSALSLVVAGGAAALGVVAITTDDVATVTPSPPVVVEVPTAPAVDQATSRPATLAVIEECGTKIRGVWAC